MASMLSRTLAKTGILVFSNLQQTPSVLIRHSSDVVHHTWPPSNVLTQSILSLIRENVLSTKESDASLASVVDVTVDATPDEKEDVNVDAIASSSLGRPFPVIVDMTFGDGLHSRAILEEFRQESDLVLFAMDRDPKAVELAEKLSKEETKMVVPLHAKFSDCLTHFETLVSHPGFADVVLIDPGLSKLQEEDDSRGFTIRSSPNSPLDLRMDPSSTIEMRKPSSSSSTFPSVNTPTGAEVLSSLSLLELAQIFKKYGEEKNNKALSNLIYDTKYAFGPIETTGDLVKVISSHAYKEYQSEREYASLQRKQTLNVLKALRYFVNDELNELYAGIEAAFVLLKPEGLLLISADDIAHQRVIKEALDAYQGPVRPLEVNENVGLGSRAIISFSVRQDEANPSLVFSREEVESMLTRKWKKLRKELVMDDASHEPDRPLHHQSMRRMRAVLKNPLFDYRTSIEQHLTAR